MAKYDVTNSVQLLLDVSILNKKLGLIKNSTNTSIVSSTYDNSLEKFEYDSITIYANEVLPSINMDQLNSIGSFSSLYSDFIAYVNSFLNYEEGFSSLFILKLFGTLTFSNIISLKSSDGLIAIIIVASQN